MEKPLIAQPKSRFMKVKCKICGHEQIMFNHAKTRVECHVCAELLATPSGGKAVISESAEIVEEIE